MTSVRTELPLSFVADPLMSSDTLAVARTLCEVRLTPSNSKGMYQYHLLYTLRCKTNTYTIWKAETEECTRREATVLDRIQ